MDGSNYIHSLCLFTLMNTEHGKRYWKCHTHSLEMYEVNEKLMSGWRIGQELHKKNKEKLTVSFRSTYEKHPNLYLNWTANFCLFRHCTVSCCVQSGYVVNAHKKIISSVFQRYLIFNAGHLRKPIDMI